MPLSQTITIAGREFGIYSFTGKVASASKNLETVVSGSGGGNYNERVNISSTTKVHDTLFLINQEGEEKSFQLEGFDVACREGNFVTVKWIITGKNERGPYFAVVNHTTGKRVILKHFLKEAVNFWFKSNGCLLTIVIFAITAYIGYKDYKIGVILVLLYIVLLIRFYLMILPHRLKKLDQSIEYPNPQPW